jgi:selenocysteine-specific elongation factor
LRRISPAVTIGGGIVLQTVKRTSKRDLELLQFLGNIERGANEEILLALVTAAPQGVSIDEIIAHTAWLEHEVNAAAQTLAGRDLVLILDGTPPFFALRESVDACSSRIRKYLSQFHRENPLKDGMGLQELRSIAGGGAGNPMFQAAFNRLVASGELAVTEDKVKLADHTVKQSPEEARAKEEIASTFAQAGLAVPSIADVFQKAGLKDARAQSLLQLLLREGVLIKVAEGFIIHMNALIHLGQLLDSHKNARGPRLSVPAFKELAGVSRKYAIPLLEYLDRTGATRREGDERVIIRGTFSGAPTNQTRAHEDSESR